MDTHDNTPCVHLDEALDMPKVTLLFERLPARQALTAHPRTGDRIEGDLVGSCGRVIVDHVSGRPDLRGLASLYLVTPHAFSEVADLSSDDLVAIASTCRNFASRLPEADTDGATSLYVVTTRTVAQVAGVVLADLHVIADACDGFARVLDGISVDRVEVNHG